MHTGFCAGLRHCVVAACIMRYVLLVSYTFCTISVSDTNESFKTFLTLVEIKEVTKLFLYMELEDYYFEENEKNIFFIT